MSTDTSTTHLNTWTDNYCIGMPSARLALGARIPGVTCIRSGDRSHHMVRWSSLTEGTTDFINHTSSVPAWGATTSTATSRTRGTPHSSRQRRLFPSTMDFINNHTTHLFLFIEPVYAQQRLGGPGYFPLQRASGRVTRSASSLYRPAESPSYLLSSSLVCISSSSHLVFPNFTEDGGRLHTLSELLLFVSSTSSPFLLLQPWHDLSLHLRVATRLIYRVDQSMGYVYGPVEERARLL